MMLLRVFSLSGLDVFCQDLQLQLFPFPYIWHWAKRFLKAVMDFLKYLVYLNDNSCFSSSLSSVRYLSRHMYALLRPVVNMRMPRLLAPFIFMKSPNSLLCSMRTSTTDGWLAQYMKNKVFVCGIRFKKKKKNSLQLSAELQATWYILLKTI